jgi:hypothetical protein
MLRNADRVFFPTRKYVDIFQACQIPTFPCPTTQRYQRSRILQQLLFDYADCPHPYSRIYYGTKQKKRILDHFRLPVLVMETLNVPGTIHVVHSVHELERLVNMQHSVIVREFLQFSERVQLICVQFEPIGALRQADDLRCAEEYTSGKCKLTPAEQSNDVHAAIAEPVPLDNAALTKPLGITKQLLLAARLDDILIEWGNANGRWLVLGMARPPVRWLTPRGTMNRHHYICDLIQSGVL